MPIQSNHHFGTSNAIKPITSVITSKTAIQQTFQN